MKCITRLNWVKLFFLLSQKNKATWKKIIYVKLKVWIEGVIPSERVITFSIIPNRGFITPYYMKTPPLFFRIFSSTIFDKPLISVSNATCKYFPQILKNGHLYHKREKNDSLRDISRHIRDIIEFAAYSFITFNFLLAFAFFLSTPCLAKHTLPRNGT